MRLTAASIVLAFSVSACASTGPSSSSDAVYDPFENLNRGVYGFNESVDKAVFTPVVVAYNDNVPEPVRDGLHNFLLNLNAPVTLANDILQGKPKRAGETIGRFIVNTTFGVGGLFDVAKRGGVEGHTEDFGQTLGVWGIGMGPYFVAPFLGPTNLRDTTGRAIDMVFNPFTWIEFNASNLDVYLSAGQTVTAAFDARARLQPAFDNLRSQPEPYVALRRAYSNNRRSAVKDGAETGDLFDSLPDFDEYDDDFEDDFAKGFSALQEDG